MTDTNTKNSPCAQIASVSKETKTVVEDISSKYGISILPTFGDVPLTNFKESSVFFESPFSKDMLVDLTRDDAFNKFEILDGILAGDETTSHHKILEDIKSQLSARKELVGSSGGMSGCRNFCGTFVKAEFDFLNFEWIYSDKKTMRELRKLTVYYTDSDKGNVMLFKDTRSKLRFCGFLRWRLIEVSPFIKRNEANSKRLLSELTKIMASELAANMSKLAVDGERPFENDLTEVYDATRNITVSSSSVERTSVLLPPDSYPVESEEKIGNMFSSLFGVKSVADSITRASESIDQASKAAIEVTEKNESLFGKIAESLESIKNVTVTHEHNFSLAGCFTKYTEPFFNSIAEYIPAESKARTVVMCFVVSTVYYYMISRELSKTAKYSIMALIIGLIYMIKDETTMGYALGIFGFEAAKDLITYFLSTDTDDEDKEANSALEKIPLMNIETFMRNTTSLLVLAMLGIEGYSDTSTLLQKCMTFKAIKGGIDFTFASLGLLFTDIINLLASPFGLTIFRSRYGDWPEIYGIQDRFKAFHDMMISGKRLTKVHFDEFNEKVIRLDEIERDIPKGKENLHNQVYINQINIMRQMQKTLQNRFVLLGLTVAGFRHAPMPVILVSPGGCGKTTVINALSDALMPIQIGADEFEQYKKNRNAFISVVDPSDEYDERTKNGHVVLVVDDLFQQKNNSCEPGICHGKFMIQVINNNPKVVNKAFGDKGEVWYNADILYASTNCFKLEPDRLSVVALDPLTRRLRNAWKVELKDEYKHKWGTSEWAYRLKDIATVDTDAFIFIPGSYENKDGSYRFTTDRSQMSDPDNVPLGPLSYKEFVEYQMCTFVNHRVTEELKIMEMSNARNDPKFTPFPNHSGAEILMKLMTSKFANPKTMGVDKTASVSELMLGKATSGVSKERIEKDMEEHNFGPFLDIINRMVLADYEFFIDIIKNHEKEFEAIIEHSDEYVAHIEFSSLSTEKFLDVLGQDLLRLKRDSSYVKRFVKKVKKTFTKTIPEFFKQMVEIDPTVEKIYVNDPDFCDMMQKEIDDFNSWTKDKGSVVGTAMWTADKLVMHPITDFTIVTKCFVQTWQICRLNARRFTLSTWEIYKMFRETATWTEFVTNSASIINREVRKATKDILSYLGDLHDAFFLGGIWRPTYIGLAIGAITALSSYITEDNIEAVANSVIRIKTRGKKVDKTKASVSRAASKVAEPFTEVIKIGDSRADDDAIVGPMRAVLKSNFVTIEEAGSPLTHAVFLEGHELLMHWHSSDHLVRENLLHPDSIFTVVDWNGVKTEVMTKDCKITDFKDTDFSIISLSPITGNLAPSLVKSKCRFFSEKEIPDLHKLSCTINYAMVKSNDGVVTRESHWIPAETWFANTNYSVGENHFARKMFNYRIDGFPSSCMSPLWVTDDRYPNEIKIIGFHTAGNRAGSRPEGSATLVTTEMIKEMLSTHRANYGMKEPNIKPPIPTALSGNSNIPERMTVVKEMPDLPMNLHSAWKKTPFYEFMGIETNKKIPAVLQEYDVVVDNVVVASHNPQFNAMKGYCADTKAFNKELTDMAFAMTMLKWDASKDPSHIPSVFTYDDVINGRANIGPDSRTSSVGQELRYRGITKEMIYGKEGRRDIDNPVLKELLVEVDELISKLKDGVPPDVAFLGFGKSELLYTYKVLEDGKLRYISGSEWKDLIVSKVFFGDLQSEAIAIGIQAGYAMGINPFSMDWNTVGNILKSYGKLSDSDQGQWDKRLNAVVFYYFGQFCRRHYYNASEEEHTARDAIIWRMQNSLHVVKTPDGTFMVKWKNSLTSGHFLTQLFGSFANQFLSRYNYLMSWTDSIGVNHLEYDTKVHEKPHLETLEENLYILVLSDDNVIAIKTELFPWNSMTMAKNWTKMGFKVTPADKDGEIDYEWKTLDEIMFLRRRWVWSHEHRRWIAPIAMDSILHALYWSEKKMKFFHQVVDTMLQEVSLHGREQFDNFVSMLLTRANNIGFTIRSVYLSYDISINFVLNTTYAPWGEMLTEVVYNASYPKIMDANSRNTDGVIESDSEPGLKDKADTMLGHEKCAPFYITANPVAGTVGSGEVARVGLWTIVTTEKEYGSDSRRPYVGPDFQVSPLSSEKDEIAKLADPGINLYLNMNSKSFNEIIHKYQIGSEGAPSPIDKVANMEALTEEKHVTTVVTSEGTVDSLALSAPVIPALSHEQSAIRDFLMKDVIVGTVTWSTSDTVNTALISQSIYAALGADNDDKIKGFGLFRATAVFSLFLNAQPFQAGRLLMHYLPVASSYANGWIQTRNIHLTTKTQQPHVELDCRHSGAEIRIPYISPFNYYDKTTNTYDWGSLYVTVLSALATGVSGASTADVTLMVRWEDVEFSAPMVGNARAGRSLSDKEAAAIASSGSISNGLRTVSKVASALSSIPSLAAYTGPVAWASNVLAGTASAFGYSKPHDDTPPRDVQILAYKYSATGDGVDMSIPLSVSSQNGLRQIKDCSFRAEDEMSIAFLKKVQAYKQSLVWSTSNASGDFLFNAVVGPSILNNAVTYVSGAKTVTMHVGPPVWYLNQFMPYYRGSLHLRLQIVKTIFHTGRLLIQFQATNGTTTAPNAEHSAYNLREIIDIRATDTIELDLPYMLPHEFIDSGDGIGRLSISVLNDLRAPETVSSSIGILMFFSGGDDFELAGPAIGTTSTVPLMVGNSRDGDETTRDGVVGDATIPTMTTLHTERVFGESILSVKQLINRNNCFWFSATPTSMVHWYLKPWWFSATTTSAGSITASGPGGDILSAMGLMYCFYRGSMRLTLGATIVGVSATGLYDTSTTAVQGSAQNMTLASTPWQLGGNLTGAYGLTFIEQLSPSSANIISVKIPYYNHTKISLVQPNHSTTLYTDGSQPTVGAYFGGFNANGVSYARSAGEDFRLSGFIGAPPLFVSIV